MDRKIGLVYYGIALIFTFYIVVYDLIIMESYLMREHTHGGSTLVPKGTFIGTSDIYDDRIFDASELVRVQAETSAIFIATNISITPL